MRNTIINRTLTLALALVMSLSFVSTSVAADESYLDTSRELSIENSLDPTLDLSTGRTFAGELTEGALSLDTSEQETFTLDSVDESDLLPMSLSQDDGISNFIPMSESAPERERARGEANVTGIDIGSITHTLNASNPIDIIFFSLPVARTLWLNLSSTNSNYVVHLGFVSANGSVSIYTNSVGPGGYAAWNLGATNNAAPFWALVVMSNGSTGTPYTLRWNMSIPPSTVSKYLHVSPDLSNIVTLVTGNNHIALNGTTTIFLGDLPHNMGNGSSQLNWTGKWLRDAHTPWGGYDQRTVTVNDIQIRRANNNTGDLPAVGFYNYRGFAPGSGSSTLAVALPLARNTLYMHHLSSYRPSPNGTTRVEDWNCYLGLRSPRRLFIDPLEVLLAHDHYIIVDVATGTPIDLWGNLNKFYTRDGYQMPILTGVPSL